jgi:hypothetical protein
MLVFCGRNVCMTSLASTPPSYSFHHTYSSTIFFKLCRDEERIQLPIHTGPFRQHQRNQTCQNSRVSIRGSKGFKEVSVLTNGRRKTSKKKLSKKEMECIRKCQFIPGLFRSCEKCLL